MLKNQFSLDYKYLASPKIGRCVKEIYAFLFRTDKVKYLEESYVFSDEEDLFIKETFFAKFKAVNFDFYVIILMCYFSFFLARFPFIEQIYYKPFQIPSLFIIHTHNCSNLNWDKNQ